MALKAPGIEIREIDKSQYSQAPNPTQVYIVGFAQKGELYKRMVFTSRAAWLLYYGEPTNEAERYFYNACMEVINQGGTLYCARIPYENESKEKYVAKKYKVESKLNTIPEIYDDYLNAGEKPVTELLDGCFTRFSIGFDDEDSYKGGKVALANINGKASLIDNINEAGNKDKLAFDYVYDETPDIEHDTDWISFRQTSIFERLVALFDPNSIIGSKISLDKSDLWKFLSDTEDYAGKSMADVTPEDWVKAFCYAYAEVFGPEATSLKPWRFVYAALKDNDKDGNPYALYTFLTKNKAVLDSFLDAKTIYDPVRKYDDRLSGDSNFDNGVCEITAEPVEADYLAEYGPFIDDENEIRTQFYLVDLETWRKSDKANQGLLPFIYFDEDKCNLMANYTAAVNMLGLNDLNPEYWKEMNSLIDLSKYLDKGNDTIALRAEDEVVDYIAYIKDITGAKYTDGYAETDEEEAKTLLAAHSANIYRLLSRMTLNEKVSDFRDKMETTACVPTLFAKKCIELYLDNTNVTGNWDLIRLRNATDLGIFGNSPVDDVDDAGNVYDDDSHADPDFDSYFKKYSTTVVFRGEETKIKSLADLVQATAKQLSKVELIQCIEDIRNGKYFERILEYIPGTPEKPEAGIEAVYGSFNPVDVLGELKWSEIREEDPDIKDFYKITSDSVPTLITQDNVTEYEADESRVPLNTFYIVDKTRGAYGKCKTASEVERADKSILGPGEDHECIGIVPVVTTAANALKAQKIIDANKSGEFQFGLYEPLRAVQTLDFTDWTGFHSKKAEARTRATLIDDSVETSIKFKADDPDENETLSQQAASMFPSISSTDTGLDRDEMKKIGIVVFRAFLDASEGNKISFSLLESFVGELDRGAINPNTGASTFIDKIVNAQSDYIYCFSNCFSSSAKQEEYRKEADILTIEPQKAASLGFYEDMVKDDISLTKSIYDGLNKSFDKSSNIDEVQIDIVVDAGMSNIAQYIYSVYGAGGKGVYDPTSTEAAMYKLKNKDSIKTWKTVIMDYFNNFCKNVRKDCMFVCDGPRPLGLVGNKKIIRSTKPSNTIDANILPYITYIAGLNTNFGAGYCDWFQITDEFSGEYFWCPPSIKAMGVYIYTDANFFPWYAPAGLNRGIVNALDVAFSPTNKQGGEIYEKSWNYAVDYPNDGITLWGQKTLQTKPSALDRVNVRRGLLYLERAVYLVARYFVFEQNTSYTRQRFVDLVTPIFEFCKANQGLYDYKIDASEETVNTPDVIDRNEFRCRFLLKFVKSMEFLSFDFVTLRTGASWSEG